MSQSLVGGRRGRRWSDAGGPDGNHLVNFLFWSDGLEAEGDVRVIFKTKIEMERQVPDVFNVFALGEKFTIWAENENFFFFFDNTIPPIQQLAVLECIWC